MVWKNSVQIVTEFQLHRSQNKFLEPKNDVWNSVHNWKLIFCCFLSVFLFFFRSVICLLLHLDLRLSFYSVAYFIHTNMCLSLMRRIFREFGFK